MKKFFKVVVVIAAFVLFTYLIVLDYPGFRKSLVPTGTLDVKTEQYSPDNSGEQMDVAEPSDDQQDPEEVPDVDVESELNQLYQQYPPTKVALCFQQIDESTYEELYPLLSAYDLTGTLVLRNGQLPGDNNKIATTECEELVEAGWDFAVGMSEEIELAGDPQTAATQLDSYLESYLNRIQVRVAVEPTVFFCSQGEYLEEFDAVLLDHGFTTLLYVPDGEQVLSGTGELEKIPVVAVSQETTISDAVYSTKQFVGCVVATRIVSSEIEDISVDYTTAGLDALVKTLSDDEKIEFAQIDELVSSTEAERSQRLAWLDEISRLQTEVS